MKKMILVLMVLTAFQAVRAEDQVSNAVQTVADKVHSEEVKQALMQLIWFRAELTLRARAMDVAVVEFFQNIRQQQGCLGRQIDGFIEALNQNKDEEAQTLLKEIYELNTALEKELVDEADKCEKQTTHFGEALKKTIEAHKKNSVQ